MTTTTSHVTHTNAHKHINTRVYDYVRWMSEWRTISKRAFVATVFMWKARSDVDGNGNDGDDDDGDDDNNDGSRIVMRTRACLTVWRRVETVRVRLKTVATVGVECARARRISVRDETHAHEFARMCACRSPRVCVRVCVCVNMCSLAYVPQRMRLGVCDDVHVSENGGLWSDYDESITTGRASC